MEDQQSPRIGIVGVGRAGGSLARALAAAGYHVAAVWSRTPSRAIALAQAIGARAESSPGAVASAVDLLVLAVVDAQIEPMSAAIAKSARPHSLSSAVVHLSGASDAAVLHPLAQVGYQTGAFHPLQTFADDHSPLLPGTVFAIEAPPPLHARLTEIAIRLGGKPLSLAASDRALYHAAATMTANYTVTLMNQAVALLALCGLTPEQSLDALLPLLRGAVDNLERVGLPEALTGPIVRGDVSTIKHHLAALDTRAPNVLPTYAALGDATLALAAERGTNSEQLAAIGALLQAVMDQHLQPEHISDRT